MIIQCTKALLDKLPTEKDELVSPEGYIDCPESFYGWQANIITINRRKAIVFMNNFARYPIVLYRPTVKEFKNIGDRLKEGIKVAFEAEGIREEIIERYIESLGECKFSRTAGRSIVANLNEMCKVVSAYEEYLDDSKVIQNRISLKVGRYIFKKENHYKHPNEELYHGLAKLMNYRDTDINKILAIETYQFKIKLNLKNYDIWRRILIPSNCSFAELHNVMQKVFGWFNYHMHEFRVLDNEIKVDTNTPLFLYPVKVRILDGDNQEEMDYIEQNECEVKYDTNTMLHEIFSKYHECLYIYDFGDSWEHIITLEKVIDDGINQSPILIERQGKRPPEDVGGEDGFEEYMKVISDKSNPEYESMMQWAEITKEKEQGIEEINRRLHR